MRQFLKCAAGKASPIGSEVPPNVLGIDRNTRDFRIKIEVPAQRLFHRAHETLAEPMRLRAVADHGVHARRSRNHGGPGESAHPLGPRVGRCHHRILVSEHDFRGVAQNGIADYQHVIADSGKFAN